MTVLTLNGTQVFPAGNQTIKLTRENPYFTQSESYTLDVTLPMDIMENRQFFGSIHRLEHSKRLSTMTCLLTVNNKPLLSGTAKVTQVSELEVKVQLMGGRSEINLLSSESKTYIDEMDFSVSTGKVFMPVWDETYETSENQWNDGQYNLINPDDYYPDAPQPRLVDVMKEVVTLMGYTVTENCTDIEPWNCLYIASAKRTRNIAHALPHWTVRTLVDEYCRFFNCSFLIDQTEHTVRIVSNATFFGHSRHHAIEPVDEYTIELNDESEANALAVDNISFDLSGSSKHDYDIIDGNVRESAPTKDYDTVAQARAAYRQMSADERKRYIFRTPTGMFAGWEHSMKEETGSEDTLTEFTQIDVFGPLIRDAESDSEITLKICPAAISCTVMTYFLWDISGEHHTDGKHPWRYLSMENPTGNEYNRWGIIDDGTVPTTEDATIQDYIEGEVDIEKSEKEDRMQVFFVDDIAMPSTSYEGWDKGQTINAVMPFTDFLYKRMYGASHRQWSLSLNPSPAEHYLGELHENNYSFNMKAKYCVKFLADEMPDPTQVFIIRNKRFACEKIEAQIDDQGLQQLMTGYFYEML